jgi:hypothetical protein
MFKFTGAELKKGKLLKPPPPDPSLRSRMTIFKEVGEGLRILKDKK